MVLWSSSSVSPDESKVGGEGVGAGLDFGDEVKNEGLLWNDFSEDDDGFIV